MEIKYKIWIEENGKLVFGKGRDSILEAVDRRHSIYGAAKDMGMSYRAAWGKLKVSEERAGIKMLDTDNRHQSTQLTPQSRAIKERFEKLEKDVEALLHKADNDFEKLLRH